MKERTIFHIDANSAYLSWESVYRLQKGAKVDLRTIPSIVGGSEKMRHGIVLAKSIPAKKYRIKTGEPVRDAFAKCPNLVSVPPNYKLYIKCSNAMVSIFKEYTDKVQRYSIDECFLDMTNLMHLFNNDPVKVAYEIKNRIKHELGFTVNVGISHNKLLAKMASDFTKPDKVHTCFLNEIQDKMWKLDVGDLFMVGRATKPKLNRLGIFTIGDLAKSDKSVIYAHLKSHGLMIWNYANGIEESIVRKTNYEFIKGIGNSTTVSFDVEDSQTAYKVLLGLTESVAMRLRKVYMNCQLISVAVKTKDFLSISRQRKLMSSIDSTTQIYDVAKELFDEVWNGMPIRKLGVRVSELHGNEFNQVTLFDDKNTIKLQNMDKAIDSIRNKYGSKSVLRACLLNSGLKPVIGGVEDEYPMMGSIL